MVYTHFLKRWMVPPLLTNVNPLPTPLIPHVTMRTFALQYIEENNLRQAQPCFGRMQKCQDKTSAVMNVPAFSSTVR